MSRKNMRRRCCHSWRNLAAAADAGLKDHDRWATARALLARDLGLREVMGRGRYRAWGISSGVSAVAVDTVSGRGSGACHGLRNGRPWRPDGLSFSVTCRVGVILRAVKSAPKVLTDLAVLNCHFRN